ncbi:lysophospholipid acyltransferase family protein [Aliihoeflea sp. PC F10.4]
MIGKLRLVLALAGFIPGTIALVIWQLAMKASGLGDPRRPALFWHRMVLRLLGISVRVHGELSQKRPLLIAANHVSWTDIMVLGSIAPVNFIAKAEVARWPVLGRLFRSQNSIFVERETRHRAADQTREVAEKLKSGDPLVLFAEGTTGCGNRLLPFKSTLFGAAAQLAEGTDSFAVQPAAIFYSRLYGVAMGRRHRARFSWIGDEDLIPHLVRLVTSGPIVVDVLLGETIGFDGANRKQVASRAEGSVRETLHHARRQKVL